MQSNNELQIKLRKNRDTLKIVGSGVIAFGIWSVIKALLYSELNMGTFLASIEESPVLTEAMLKTAFRIIIAIILLIDLAIRLFVGLSAIGEGRGKRKHYVYIAMAFLIAAVSFISVFFLILKPGEDSSLLELVVTLVIEVTSAVTLMQMCFSAIRVKKLYKQLAEAR